MFKYRSEKFYLAIMKVNLYSFVVCPEKDKRTNQQLRYLS
jgi:hypothetical protein